jgi:hypothetical protein
MNYFNAVQTVSNATPIVCTVVLLYTVTMFGGLLDDSQQRASFNQRLTDIELRLTSVQAYTEQRHNDLALRVDQGFREAQQRQDILEARQQLKH